MQQLEAALPTVEKLGAATLEDGWKNICAAVGNAAEAVLGTVEKNRKNDWFDGECQQILEKCSPKQDAATPNEKEC